MLSDRPPFDPAEGVRCALFRGGSSKGAFFLGADLPTDQAARDRLLLQVMGSPDARQIDGIGGAHPLTSKVAVVGPSTRPDADVDYLFLQIGVDSDLVADRQNCGNLLAAVGPFALERGLVAASDDPTGIGDGGGGTTSVDIHMVNSGGLARATFPVVDGSPVYAGDTAISGVPGTGATVELDFADLAGGTCGALLPSGNIVDEVNGLRCTLIDNGMPVVVVSATDLGVTGRESPNELEANAELTAALEALRLAAAPLMGLGDATELTVPKLTMVASPATGGALSTRTFIPHRCHQAIGVLGAVSVATAALLPGSPANKLADLPPDGPIVLEHPTGTFEASVEIDSPSAVVKRAGIIRTARKLFDGTTFPRPY